MEERLAAAEERLAWAEVQVSDLTAALERSRLCERQAIERAQEYRTSLELHLEFGAEGFLAAAPPGNETPLSPLSVGTVTKLARGFSRRTVSGDDFDAWRGVSASVAAAGAEAADEVALPSVLIAVELDLGQRAGMATLRVAPWQTRSDFDAVVREFLGKHRVKPVFTEALVKYLEEVENQASTFPAYVKADLAELYSVYG